MVTEYHKVYCKAVKQITGKEYECHKLIGLNKFEDCPFGNCIEDIFDDLINKVYSKRVMRQLYKAFTRFNRIKK